MSDPNFFKEAFFALAHAGCLGDPDGQPAYAYIRVSSAGQAEEGRSGLPRQIQHCHEIALTKGVKIPWELVFADDHSGFEFGSRPELSRLREEYKRSGRRANAIVMEYLDRLSRNADWHQGFLLDEMKEHRIRVVFWKEFTSRVERAVMGAISQEGMEQAKQRMAEGNIFKAKDSRVTARVAAYGYYFVDRHGNVSVDAKKDTHYAIKEEEALVVREMYRKIGVEGWTLRRLAKWLDEHYKAIRNAKRWDIRMIRLIIQNPLYTGKFIAHRYTYVKVPALKQRADQTTKLVLRKMERPRSEWIVVPVPAIVPFDIWETANQMLEKNARTSRRHAIEPYLLTGLVKCATCGYSYTGQRKIHRKHGKEYLSRAYRDSSSWNLMGIFRDIQCEQSQISCKRLDEAVWTVVARVLLEPQILIDAMERQFAQGPNAEIQKQIGFLHKQLADLGTEDEDLYRAYRAHAFDEQEFASRRKRVKEQREKTNQEIETLQARVVTRDRLEMNKQIVLHQSAALQEQGLVPDPPFEKKQAVLKLVVDQIRLNVDEGWFEIEGVIRGRHDLTSAIGSIPEDTDSSPRAAKSLRGTSESPALAKSKRCVRPPMVAASPLNSAHRIRATHRETKPRDAPAKSHPDAAISHRRPNPHVKSCDGVRERDANA